MANDKQGNGLGSANRIETFSDALFAIVMTLMVMQLLEAPTIPAHASIAQYLTLLLPVAPLLIGFIASFIMVLTFALNHHNLFTTLQKTDEPFMWLNGLMLFFVCLIPFPTVLISKHPTDLVPVILYGFVLLCTMLSFRLLTGHARRKKLFVPELQGDYAKSRSNRSFPGVILYAASIPLAFVSVYISLVLFALVPIIYFSPERFDFGRLFSGKHPHPMKGSR